MSDFEKLANLRIPLDDIISATNNFDPESFIAQGGFGRVYKGQLPPAHDHCAGTKVAVKRLDMNLAGQGNREFLMEIVMLTSYKHPHLVSLIGFVDEGNEKILVYKDEVNRSLDKHLASKDLTWEQRLRICLGAASGLAYLHDSGGTEKWVLHRDIKSSNILLDANFEAKISDFGLSKIATRINKEFSYMVTKACGTPGYIDPLYAQTDFTTKESDVYSFGVVLLEVLCGRPALIMKYEDERRFLPKLVKSYYGEGKLNEIIFPDLVEQMKPDSLDLYCKIALKCLNDYDRKRRPKMSSVVEELKSALDHQLGKRTVDPGHQTGTRTELWGSPTGGWEFLFKLESNQKLRKIQIVYSSFIHSLTFVVEDSNGMSYSKCYGGDKFDDAPQQTSEIVLDADEEIIGLSGSVGVHKGFTLVTSLYFKTTKHWKRGPFIQEADDCFSGTWDVGLFNGFYGRAGWYIDAVGCCLKGT